MTTTYRNSSVNTLKSLSVTLAMKGFTVSPVVIPENPWADGNPYLTTTASSRDIMIALKEVR